MRFLYINKHDPLTSILKIVAFVIVLFVAFGLVKGIHRYHAGYVAQQEKQLPFGVSSAIYSSQALDVSGWGLPQVRIQITDKDKVEAEAQVDSKNKWHASLPLKKRTKNIQTFDLQLPEQDKSYDLGMLTLFLPERSPDEAYVWWKNASTLALLTTPEAGSEIELSLVLIWADEGKFIFSGTGTPESLIQMYANNEYVGAAHVDAFGYWSLQPGHFKADADAHLRFDELHGAEVIGRRLYRPDLPLASNIPSGDLDLVRGGKDMWLLGGKTSDKEKAHIMIMKPDVGEVGSVDELIAGQIIPIVPAQSGKMLVP
ncbi:MAG: hypothetical protein WAO98_09920 [Alphaproteobacteria bacterium]